MISVPWRSSVAMCTAGAYGAQPPLGAPGPCGSVRSVTSRTRIALLVVGIVALAFNLRPAAVSVGPVLGEIREGLRMSGAEAGVLTSLPVVAFAVFGALAPKLARLLG